MTQEPSNLPGFGAEQMASRASKRAERLKNEQNLGDPTDVVRKNLAQAERTRRNYSQGAEGERMVAQVLGSLERYGWVALHDVHWPGRPKANIDHIAIGPGGIVIIDSKHWTGDVVLTSTKLSQNGYSRNSQVGAVADAANAVAALLMPEHRLATSAVLALAAQQNEPVKLMGTTVVGREHLPALLVTMAPKFSAYDVADVARFLYEELAGPESPQLTTTAALDPPKKRRRRRLRKVEDLAPSRSGQTSQPSLPAVPVARVARTARTGKDQACAAPVRKTSVRKNVRSENGRRRPTNKRKSKSSGGAEFAATLVMVGIALWWLSRIGS